MNNMHCFNANKSVIMLTSIDTYISEFVNAANRILLENTAPFNGTGHPAITINAGYSEGLPVGMMMVGKVLDEANVGA